MLGRGKPRFGATGPFSEQCHILERTKGERPVLLGTELILSFQQQKEKQEVSLQWEEFPKIPGKQLGAVVVPVELGDAGGTGCAKDGSVCGGQSVPSCRGVAQGGTAWHCLGPWSKPILVTVTAEQSRRQGQGGDLRSWVLPFLLFPWSQGPHCDNSHLDVPTPMASLSLDPGGVMGELLSAAARGSFAVSSPNPSLSFLSQGLVGSSGKS